MRNEDYYAPQPVGYCAICGEPVYPDDSARVLDDGSLIHEEGIWDYYKAQPDGQRFPISCLGAYILDNYAFWEIANALGIEKRR